jgi:hypothetical protein
MQSPFYSASQTAQAARPYSFSTALFSNASSTTSSIEFT